MKIREYVLSEMNWAGIRDSNFNLAILPWGSTEAHNYHLPFSTDSIQSEFIAHESAKLAFENNAQVVVLPTINYGVNTSQLKIKLTINLNPSTQYQILHDIVDSLSKHSIDRLVILNGHGGNDFKPAIRELQNIFPNFLIVLVNWYQVLNANQYFTEPGEHAGELETSNLLCISPELVLPLEESGEGKLNRFKISGLKEGWAWSPRLWHRATNDTGIGNPQNSSEAKGRRYLNDTIATISKLLIEMSRINISDIYEKDE